MFGTFWEETVIVLFLCYFHGGCARACCCTVFCTFVPRARFAACFLYAHFVHNQSEPLRWLQVPAALLRSLTTFPCGLHCL